MQKIRHTTAALLILALLILLLLPFALQHYAKTPAAIPTGSKMVSSDCLYLLRSNGDHLELISQDGNIRIIPSIDPRTLPSYDQNTLAEGICLDSSIALEELLQDFSG